MSRENPANFAEALRVAKQILSSSNTLVSRGLVETEAEQLVAAAYRQATGKALSRMELFSALANRIPAEAAEKVIILSHGRAEGKPLQYLTGWQQFLAHEYRVTPGVLIPRPETEFLTRFAITALKDSPPALGLEIGLGSGAISIELLHEFPGLSMRSSELSAQARDVASENARKILGPGAARLAVLPSLRSEDVFEPFLPIPRKVDFIISNPPYLTAEDGIDWDVLRHEPAEALFAPEKDPVFFYRAIAERGKEYLRDEGYVFLEVPHERGKRILALFEDQGWEAQLLPDLTERDRVLVAEIPA